jgi:hypothetical protein
VFAQLISGPVGIAISPDTAGHNPVTAVGQNGSKALGTGTRFVT